MRALEGADAQIVAVVAPAGYGKTTLLSQWLAENGAKNAWLSLERSDNDPAVLLEHLIDALAKQGLVEDGGSARFSSSMALTHGVPTLTDAIEKTQAPGWLLLDQLDSLNATSSLDVIDALLERLPSHLRVVFASRSTSGLRMALLRSRGSVFELSMAELAMDGEEASALVKGAGFDMAQGSVDLVVDRTEGWPAGIYLSTMVMNAGKPDVYSSDLRGDHVYFSQYLRDEVLGELTQKELRFLIKSSILPRLSGPLCDFVLDMDGSAEVLELLESSNLLVIPLDRTRRWYRYHSLLRDFLRNELERVYPEESRRLHQRAADWFEANEFADLAVEHAMAADDHLRVARIVKDIARPTYARGRAGTATAWFNWIEANETIRQHSDLAAVICYIRSLNGEVSAAERSAMHAFTDVEGRPIPDQELDSVALLCRSLHCRQGPKSAIDDARAARAALGSSPVWRHLPLAMEGVGLDGLGEFDTADRCWNEALELSEGVEANPFRTVAFSALAWSAVKREDWEAAAVLTERSLTVIEEYHLEPYATSGLTFAIGARIAMRGGSWEEGTTLLGKATVTRSQLSRVTPIFSVMALLEMTRASLELSDIGGARRVLRDIGDLVAARPKLGELVAEYNMLKGQVAKMPAGSVGASALTKAELRLLPMLVTHLSFPEIADRLFVSRHTVKTQAISIYRKLNVTSRTDAVESARALGLISL